MFTPLISVADLAPNVTDPNWVILDCRHDLMQPAFGATVYAEGHIQNALFASVDHDLSGPKTDADGVFRGRHPLPDRNLLVETLRRWGVNSDSQVVAYDAADGMYAARLWWLLRWIGHPSVAVLDGGLAAWQAQGLPLVTPVHTPAHGSINERPTLSWIVSADDVLANLETPTMTVIDARAPDRYRGDSEPIDPVGGHIPGAKNRFFKANLLPNGQFKSGAQLYEEFVPLLDGAATSVMQCGSGVTACHNLLAMELAGLSGAGLYPGSWSEWCSDPARPVATGA
jgi:thiosulfate/3-mercaptopyruvate sulfurtransferase